MSDTNVRLSAEKGMKVLATSSGWEYYVTKVTETRVQASGLHGFQAVDREEFEKHLNNGLIQVVEWP